MLVRLLKTTTLAIVSSVFNIGLAQSYTFTNIADDRGQVGSFSVPAINNSGTVAFRGLFNFGGVGVGIFRSNGGSIAVVADKTGQFSSFGGAPTINESGTVTFLGVLDSGPGGIFATGGTPYITIADDTGPFSFNTTPNINVAGNVAVFATVDGGGNAIIAGNGGPTNTIVSTAGPFATPFGFGSPPSAAGVVVFSASRDGGGEGIFHGDGGPIATIVDSSGPFDEFNRPAFNAEGTVAFSATLDSSGSGIFTVDIDGGPLTTIANSNDEFESFSNAAINAKGSVVFRADLDGGGSGLFTGGDSLTNKVIQIGDSLFDSTLTDFNFHAAGFNDQGEVAFSYTLLNGIRGIAVASVAMDGDYNFDGSVDVADYVVWRKTDGTQHGYGARRATSAKRSAAARVHGR